MCASPGILVNQVVFIVCEARHFVNRVVYLEVTIMTRFGFEIVFLLGGAFRRAIDGLHEELAGQGHPDARPIHGFALQAIGPDGATVSEVGRRLGVSKQAAAKTAKSLEALGYVTREASDTDARATTLRRTARANELLALSAGYFARQAAAWEAEVGTERFQAMVEALEVIGSDARLGDFPGWLG
jgi:DNA-binding MarR family transcriptional regulator